MRALRVVLILAVVLGGLGVGADRVAASYAESEAAATARVGAVRPESADVDIKGFPFLTQAADRRFDEVEVRLTGVRAQAGGRPVRIGELALDLRDVTLDGDYAIDRAGRADGTAVIGYPDLEAASGREARVEYGGTGGANGTSGTGKGAGAGKLKVTGGVRILGREITRSVLSSVTLVNGDTIRVRADEVPGEGIPGLEGLVRERTDFDRKIEGLPKGVRLTKVEARPDGLVATVAGQDVSLRVS
ncbi:DUF2993 domain-containing protein [Streptomyces sp. NPDC090025]|uniref:LmeA family phospholipid-binding protein n=1 Tax=Streptomyces sp. NPDC090025 TaxID=3365922 RepID=UPI003837AB7B